MNDKLKKVILALRSPKVLIIMGICGILLIFLSSFSNSGSKSEKTKETEDFSIETYCESLEKDIYEIVKGITGSRDVTVVVTLDSSVKYSYAQIQEENQSSKNGEKDSSNDSQHKEGYVTVKTSDGGEQALLVASQMPDIRGVAIVCQGGDSEIIGEKIRNAVTSALNITSKRVFVCGRS